MMSKKMFVWLIILVMCPVLINTGCTPTAEDTEKLVAPPEEEKPPVVIEEEKPEVVVEEDKPKVVMEEEKPEVVVEEEKPTVELALKYEPGDSTAYRLIMEARRSIKWEGAIANDAAFKGGETSSRLEMTFTQQIQSTEENGNAVAKITIDSLKHLSLVRDNPVVDFDNSRAKDQDNPLAKLIGQSYTIEITPDGRVSKVIDASQAAAAVKGSSTAHKTASAMLTTERIMDHHTIPAVPAADKNKVKTGDNWSGVKTFSFGLMGSKSYQRTYTLKEIHDTDNRRIAVVEMEANPTIADAEKLHKEQQIGDFSKMFENNETYKGQLTLDLTAGKIEKCFEELQSEWIAVEPTAGEKEEKEPAVLIMTATRIYHLEKID